VATSYIVYFDVVRRKSFRNLDSALEFVKKKTEEYDRETMLFEYRLHEITSTLIMTNGKDLR
jgi:hypothetical protein